MSDILLKDRFFRRSIVERCRTRVKNSQGFKFIIMSTKIDTIMDGSKFIRYMGRDHRKGGRAKTIFFQKKLGGRRLFSKKLGGEDFFRKKLGGRRFFSTGN